MNRPSSSSGQFNPWLGRSVGDRNRYRLDERLGGGGMGDVFLATDTRLGKPVALKLLKESLAIAEDLDLKERFERECAICAALKSAHIVQVSDYGVTSEGYPFYVMEYLQGQTLDQLLTEQPRLSVARTCNIITQVCAGLQLAHEGVVIWNRETNSSERIKVVHRDLKPANIFLVPSALGELAKIIDFGIAKIQSLQAEYTSYTNVFLGTCHYAPPEQFDGGQEIDERADVYSLGIILYEMLTGTDPFGLDFRQNKVTNSAWLAAHATKAPKPLRSRPNSDAISPALEAVVMRCLEKSPSDRFASVKDLRNALQAASAELPAAARQAEEMLTSDAETQVNQKFVQSKPQPFPPSPQSFQSPSSSPSPQSPPSRPAVIQKQLKKSSRRPSLALIGTGALLSLAIGVYAVPRLLQSSLFKTANSTAAITNHTHEVSLVSTLSGSSSPVWATVMTPDGQTLISAGEDRDAAGQFYPIKLWDVKTGQVLSTLDGHLGIVRSLSISEDGKTLASGSDDNTIKIWDLTTGNLIRTLEGHSAPVRSVALSRDGKTLISGSDDKTVKIWDLQTGGNRTLIEHTAPVYTVAISSDGTKIASGSEDKTIRLWDLATGELLRTIGTPGGHNAPVSAVAFSPNGQHLATGGWDNKVNLWNVETGQLLQTFGGHSDHVIAIAFMDEHVLATASLDHTIKVWNADTGQPLQNIPAHSDSVLSVTAQPDESTLISSSSDTTIRIWR